MRPYVVLPALLAAHFACHAQGVETTTLPGTPYQAQHDTLWARAGRVRAQVVARVESFHTSYFGIGGTRRVVVSTGKPVRLSLTDPSARVLLLRREVVKHKTHGAEIRKVTYYYPGQGRWLYEYYEDGHLVQLELYHYPVANGAGGFDLSTMHWVRGDYLRVRQVAAVGGGVQEQVYTNPATNPN